MDVNIHVVEPLVVVPGAPTEDPIVLLSGAQVRLQMKEKRLRIVEAEVHRLQVEGQMDYGFIVDHLTS